MVRYLDIDDLSDEIKYNQIGMGVDTLRENEFESVLLLSVIIYQVLKIYCVALQTVQS